MRCVLRRACFGALTLLLAGITGSACLRGTNNTNSAAPLERAESATMSKSANHALVLVNTMVTLYNQIVAGHEVGDISDQRSCAGGGSARVGGETSLDVLRDITKVDLMYEFAGCAIAHASPEARLTIHSGMFRQTGSFDTTGFVGETVMGRVEMEGTVAGQPIARGFCEVSWTRSGQRAVSGSFRMIAGSVCGEAFGFSPPVTSIFVDAGVDAGIDGAPTDGGTDGAIDATTD